MKIVNGVLPTRIREAVRFVRLALAKQVVVRLAAEEIERVGYLAGTLDVALGNLVESLPGRRTVETSRGATAKYI